MCLVADSSAADSSLFEFVFDDYELPPFKPSARRSPRGRSESSCINPFPGRAGMSMSRWAFVRAPLPRYC
jgi:hypothetical protein